MFTLSELFSRLFSLRKEAERSTLKGVLFTGAIATILGFLSLIFVAFPLLLGTSFLIEDAGLSQEVAHAILIVVRQISQLGCLLFYTTGLTGCVYGALRLLNKEEVGTKQLIADSARFAFSGTGLSIGGVFVLANTIASVGYIFLIIPGMIATNVTLVMLFRLVDTRCGFNEALSFAWGAISKNLISSTLFFSLVAFLSVMATLFSLFLLLPFTLPISALAGTVFYGSVTGKPLFGGAAHVEE